MPTTNLAVSPAPAAARYPAYRQVADALRAEIKLRKTGAEDGRLATEAELMVRHKVSRQTVRRAYMELVADGLVQRIQGRGTFPVSRGHYARSFASIEELLALSVDTELEIIHPLSTVDDSEIATALGLQFNHVLYVGYRRLHNNLPFCFTKVYVPTRFRDILRTAPFVSSRRARSSETILGILDTKLVHGVVGARQVITAVTVPSEIATLIDTGASQAVMRIERTHFDSDGRPVELCINYFNPERYVYRQQLQRDSRPGSRSDG